MLEEDIKWTVKDDRTNSDTAGSYHITIVSFNKHFFKLYIFILQGSSLVDMETHSVCGSDAFSSPLYDEDF